MTHPSKFKMSLPRCGILILALALAGCNRDQVKVQQVPKDADQGSPMPLLSQSAAGNMQANPHAGMDMGGAPALGQVKWTLPAGWREKDLGQMRVGSFDAGKEGQAADVSIIPLPSTPGGEMELANLNMWRQSLDLPPADKAESQPVPIGSAQGKLYEISDSKSSSNILAAVLDKDGMSWYFKMKGKSDVVAGQKPAFLDFLKSVSFDAPATAMSNPHEGMQMPAAAETAGTTSAGVALPAGWKEIPNPTMLLAKYVIQGSGDAKAEVNVSQTGGGVLLNINRWRGQLGLAQISEEEFSKLAQPVDVAGGKGLLVDMTGTDSKTGKKARLVGIIVPGAADSWFYKLMGDEQIVTEQKDVFTKFIQSAKFSNAP